VEVFQFLETEPLYENWCRESQNHRELLNNFPAQFILSFEKFLEQQDDLAINADTFRSFFKGNQRMLAGIFLRRYELQTEDSVTKKFKLEINKTLQEHFKSGQSTRLDKDS
jgi:hypothetical protein